MNAQSTGRGSRRHRFGHPHPVDVHVGARVRLRRTLIGMSQEKLGEAIGLTFQQVQKYERGTNRVGASRLYELSRVLDVPVGFFFDELDPRLLDSAAATGLAEAPAPVFEHVPFEREMLEIVRTYQRIGDPAVRRRLFDLARAIANAYFPPESA
jgi:transcriptional regulator with XRE-family HTH domain